MDYPKLSAPVWLTLAALLCLILAWRQEQWADWLRLFLVCSGLLFLIVALVSLWDVVAFRANEHLLERNRANAITERVALVQALGKMNVDQLKALDHYIPMVDVISGDAGPIYVLRLPMNEECPMMFVKEFIRSGDDEYLQSIRSYREGTREREYAQMLTSWMTFQGWVSGAAGNRPARWVDKERALRALGMIEPNWKQA